MTNPNNSIGTNGAFGGRTSVNAFNDGMGGYSRGVLSGWNCVPNSGLTVSIGGDGTHRDVAVAVDNAGNKTSINNISNSPVNVTIGAAPGTNSRIDAIVAYVDNPPSGTSTATDNPAACGIIVVQGTTASSPVNPTDAQIRTGITADGASGTTAYYVVIAYITMASGTTDITANEITQGAHAQLGKEQIGNSAITTPKINNGAVTAAKIDFSTLSGNYSTTEQNTGYTWVDGSTIYKKTVEIQSTSLSTGDNTIQHGVSGIKNVINYECAWILSALQNTTRFIPGGTSTHSFNIGTISATEVTLYTTLTTAGTLYLTLYYTKS